MLLSMNWKWPHLCLFFIPGLAPGVQRALLAWKANWLGSCIFHSHARTRYYPQTDIHRRFTERVGPLLRYVCASAILEVAALSRYPIQVNGVNIIKRSSTKCYKIMLLIFTHIPIYSGNRQEPKTTSTTFSDDYKHNYSLYGQHTGQH